MSAVSARAADAGLPTAAPAAAEPVDHLDSERAGGERLYRRAKQRGNALGYERANRVCKKGRRKRETGHDEASMQIFDADILKKELGVNAVRTSHYPQSQDFIRRCDEIGLLVFTEFPGWQHIGDEEWKRQAVQNLKEMIVQYRNHPSIILWGVRINESQDDDVFYRETNRVAHELDDTRATGGVRMLKKSHLLEDVYTYNDFLHDGRHPGCNPKRKVTPDMKKPYLISEYNGHMFPTKPFDDEEHRTEHAIRHANVLNAVAHCKQYFYTVLAIISYISSNGLPLFLSKGCIASPVNNARSS